MPKPPPLAVLTLCPLPPLPQVAAIGGDATAPCSSLNSAAAKASLMEQLVRPAVEQLQSVVAVRLTWPKDDSARQAMWDQITAVRHDLDALAMQLPHCLYFVSAITAVKQCDRSKKETKIWPAVGYWAVLKQPVGDCKLIINAFSQNSCGAAVRLMLQPYQTSEKDVSGVLYNMVKDNVRGCVPRMVQASLQRQHRTSAGAPETPVRVCAVDKEVLPHLHRAAAALQDARFATDVIEMCTD